MPSLLDRAALFGAILKNIQILKARPAVVLFLLKYMKGFNIVNAGGHLILHSHLPPVNSAAYTRFINEHLLSCSSGPSHAQIAITDICPQNCGYCYNKKRSGTALSTEEIINTAKELKALGVFWLGLTGGEPLMNKDILKIIESVSKDCSVKLFTTGCGLNEKLAADLKKAGLFSVSVSLDSSKAEEHDRIRDYRGAFDTAIKAVRTFKEAGIHVSVSAVFSKDMIRAGSVPGFLEFLQGLGVHEAWLSEAKPSSLPYWDAKNVVTDEDIRELCLIQENYNKKGGMTVNYLAHFEGPENFGCNAGHKMIYVDAFGEAGPCVFIPMSFGNVKNEPVGTIWKKMNGKFKPGRACFINKNHGLLKKYYAGKVPFSFEDSVRITDEVVFGPPPKFTDLLNG